MHRFINKSVAVTFILCCLITWISADALTSCGSCGDECFDACGTRFFRTCCFNYLRKRSVPPIPPPADDYRDLLPWSSRAQIEKFIQQENLNELEQQHPQHLKSGTATGNQIGQLNGHDQIHAIYDI